MTRFRHTQLDPSRDVVTTHCTIDSGDGTLQTAVTFRCGEDRVDVLAVCRPDPKSSVAGDDWATASKLF